MFHNIQHYQLSNYIMTEVKEMLLKTLSTYSFWPWKFMPKYEYQWGSILITSYVIIRKTNSKIIFFIYQWIYEKSIQQYGMLLTSMHFLQDNHLHFAAIYWICNDFMISTMRRMVLHALGASSKYMMSYEDMINHNIMTSYL